MFPALKLLNSVYRGLKIGENVITSLTKTMEATLELQEEVAKKKAELGEPIDIAQQMLTTQGLMEQLTQILKLAKQIPDTVETVGSLQDRLKKEMAGDNIARGGKKTGNRADPK